jgi:hypothetical protein
MSLINKTKAEKLAIKDNLTDDDLSYIMTMDHVEYKEYSLANSRNRGIIRYFKDLEKTKKKR